VARHYSIRRPLRAGVVRTTASAVVCEIHRTWSRPEATELAQLYTMVAPNYRAVVVCVKFSNLVIVVGWCGWARSDVSRGRDRRAEKRDRIPAIYGTEARSGGLNFNM
jgi:hypothetical protein